MATQDSHAATWRVEVERLLRFDLDGLDELLTRNPRTYTDVAMEMETLQEVARAMVEVLDAR